MRQIDVRNFRCAVIQNLAAIIQAFPAIAKKKKTKKKTVLCDPVLKIDFTTDISLTRNFIKDRIFFKKPS